jgi:hypothetical protein
MQDRMKRRGEPKEKAERKKKKTNEKAISECQTQKEIEKFGCPELKEYLSANNLSKVGNKPILVARVFHHLCMSKFWPFSSDSSSSS